jgi:hypothetical protein
VLAAKANVGELPLTMETLPLGVIVECVSAEAVIM